MAKVRTTQEYGDPKDPLTNEEWLMCVGCQAWLHHTCAEETHFENRQDIGPQNITWERSKITQTPRTMTKVAVVTGSNKGIGFAIVRGLCKQFDGDVYLTARDEERGQEAVKKLREENLDPKFHQLDITDTASIARLKAFLQEKYQGLDILVNNAGFAFKGSATETFPVQAEETLKINFWGTQDACKQLFPLLRPGARVVNLSTFVTGWFVDRCTEPAKDRLRNCKKMEDVEKLMNDFVSAAKAGTAKENGWPEMSYGMSKVGVNLMTTALQEVVAEDTSRPNILVNSCDPGHVKTDMSSHSAGAKTIDEGADTPLFLALLPQDATEPRGDLYSDRKPMKWI